MACPSCIIGIKTIILACPHYVSLVSKPSQAEGITVSIVHADPGGAGCPTLQRAVAARAVLSCSMHRVGVSLSSSADPLLSALAFTASAAELCRIWGRARIGQRAVSQCGYA